MLLAVRFRYYTATTPSFDIVELNDKQWREFFLLERSFMRMEWMINFLNRQHLRHKIKELWWIPIDNQSALHVNPSSVIPWPASATIQPSNAIAQNVKGYMRKKERRSINR